jgi:prophage regulatory protein
MNMPINTPINNQSSYKMLRMKQLIEYTGLSRSTLYDMMDVKSKRYDYDSTFPRGIKLTEATVCWLESEVNTWIDSKILLSRRL